MEVKIITMELLESLEPQESQSQFRETLKDKEYLKNLVEVGGFAAVENGVVMACGGLIEQVEGRYIAWTIISKHAAKKLVGVIRAIRLYLDFRQTRRIEMTVVPEFAPGHRMAKMLGFCYEGRMSKFFMDGTDADLYARVK